MNMQRIFLWNIIICSCFIVSACAQGGHGNASGNCATAIGGSANVTVSPDTRLALGDSAIDAATKAVTSYLSEVPKVASAVQGITAREKALSAVELDKGRPLTEAERQATESYSKTLVSHLNSKCAS